MSATVLAASGWLAAAAALVVVWLLRLEGERRMALVAQAAHELRAPLGAALLGLHGVVDGAAGARRVAAVELELRRAGLALADLDAAPRGRRAPGRTEALDVRALLAEAVEAWRPLAAALAGELHVDAAGPPLVVRADRLRLTQAVGNVVLNALEHGAGPVRVRVHATSTHVRIEVRDHGPGLPAPVAALAGTPPRRPPRPRARDRRARRRRPRRPAAHRAGHRGRVRRARAPARRRAARARVAAHRPGARRRRAARRAGRAPPDEPAARAARERRRGMSRRRRAVLLLGLALLLGGLAASDVARREAAVRAQLGPVVAVVVARADLPAGRALTGADLGLRRVPARYAPVGAASVPETLIGQRLASAVPRGGVPRRRADRGRAARRPARAQGRARRGGRRPRRRRA